MQKDQKEEYCEAEIHETDDTNKVLKDKVSDLET